MMDHAEFRRVMGHFATGVAVVTTTRGGGTPVGLTVSAVSSVSLQPTMVLVCVEKGADSHDAIGAAGCFAVSFLEEGTGEALARRFSGKTGGAKFDGVGWRPETTGSPVLEEALAWVDCRLSQALPGGDHTVFLGEVVAGDAHEGSPLIYYRGGYGRLAP
jgi:flavin reductase (DIM6/NTAB) family NADH-FMN oxidoreductase RutF